MDDRQPGPPGTLPPGASAYFSPPEDTLDPALFDGDRLREPVRARLVDLLHSGLRSYLGLTGTEDWCRAWLAGSAITYQWRASRGTTGDLDVLFGVDYPQMLAANPAFPAVDGRSAATWIDSRLKKYLWPKTSREVFGHRVFEATFYWNPGVAGDITVIRPYAAYSLDRDAWDVRPPELPRDPRSLYPAEWFTAASADTAAAQAIAQDYRRNPASRAAIRARDLFEAIHGGRKAAFVEQGRGYSDYANFRWQHAKETGVIEALREVMDAYPQPEAIASGDLITRAALRYAVPRYDRPGRYGGA